MAYYNCTRQVDALLESTQHKPPSFTIHLHSEHWTLNNGSKFLYNNQIASLLDDVRAHRIPVDFLDLFDKVGVPFYEGCLVVELLDYRAKPVQRSAKENNAASNHTANPPAPNASVPPVPPQPERMRVVLHPNSETLWSDVCAMNAKAEKHWTDAEALEVEAKILLATSSSLCLDPDPHLTRIANHVLRVSMPTVPQSLKRKAATQDKEEDETEKARRAKIMQFMNPRMNRVHAASYRILDTISRTRTQAANNPAQQPLGSQPARPQSQPQQPHVEQQQQQQPQSLQIPPSNLTVDALRQQAAVEAKVKSGASSVAGSPYLRTASPAMSNAGAAAAAQMRAASRNSARGPSPALVAQSPRQNHGYLPVQSQDAAMHPSVPTPPQKSLQPQPVQVSAQQQPVHPQQMQAQHQAQQQLQVAHPQPQTQPQQHQVANQPQTSGTPVPQQFQPQIPSAQFLQPPPTARQPGQAKAGQQQPTPQQMAAYNSMIAQSLNPQQRYQAALFAAQQQQQQQANGRASPQAQANAARAAMQAGAQAGMNVPARSSPLVGQAQAQAQVQHNKSPMPQAHAQPQQLTQQQQQQVIAHQQQLLAQQAQQQAQQGQQQGQQGQQQQKMQYAAAQYAAAQQQHLRANAAVMNSPHLRAQMAAAKSPKPSQTPVPDQMLQQQQQQHPQQQQQQRPVQQHITPQQYAAAHAQSQFQQPQQWTQQQLSQLTPQQMQQVYAHQQQLAAMQRAGVTPQVYQQQYQAVVMQRAMMQQAQVQQAQAQAQQQAHHQQQLQQQHQQ